MRAHSSFDYALVRVVPRVERGECLNAGVIVFCRTRRFLAAAVELDVDRLLALDPRADRDDIARHLATIPRIAAGEADAGPIARLSQAERFHWLVSPSSAIVQPSPVHSGLCADPAAALDHLMETMVRLPMMDG
jgi:Protein of unknown function (DUF3037)